MLTLSQVIVLGSLPEDPKLTYREHGTPQCAFTLLLEEQGLEHTHRLYVPCDLYGDRAEHVAESMRPGNTGLVEGKLRWHSWVDKKGEKQGKLAVRAWSVEEA